MSGTHTTQWHIPRWLRRWCGCILLLILIPANAPASDSLEQKSPQTTTEAQLPPRLAPLGLEKLMEMEVTTVTRTASTVGESAAAVHVITQEDIRRSGATTIPELFRRVPGTNVARIDGNKWAIGVRGFNARFQDKLLVQVDGRSVYNPLFSGVYWDAVDYPLEDIERIEVIRGPGASVWGANAVNGVINIVTKSAWDTQGGLLSAGGGTEEHGFGTVRYGGMAASDLAYRIYAKGFSRDKQFAVTEDTEDDWWGSSAGTRLDWQPTDRDTATFDAAYLRSVAGRRDLRPTTDPASVATVGGLSFPNAFVNIENEITDAAHLLGRWTRTVDTDNSWSVQAYWTYFFREVENLQLNLHWNIFDVDFQHQFPLGERQKLVYGAGYRFTDSFAGSSGRDEGFATSYEPANRKLHLFSAFLQDQIALVPEKLEFTLGSKFEHNEFTGFEVQPTARLLWTPTPRQSGWAAASRAVRTPNVFEDTTRSTVLPSAGPIFPQIRGNRELESEEVWAYELGHRVQMRDNLFFDTALFYNDYHNLRVSVPGALITGPPDILPLTFDNGMNAETYGAELGADWRPAPWWRLYGAYTWLKMELHRRAGLAASTEAAEGQSPEQQVYLQSSFDLPHHVELDLIGRWVDRLTGFNPGGAPGVANEIPSYFAFDARVAWRARKNLALSIVGQNLTDSHHPESGTSPFIRSPLVEIRRSVYGKVTWYF